MALLRWLRLVSLLLLALHPLVSGCREHGPKPQAGSTQSQLPAEAPNPANDAPGRSLSTSTGTLPTPSQNGQAHPVATEPAAAPQTPSALHFVTLTTGGKLDTDPLPWVIAMHGLGDRPESFAELFEGVSFAAHVYVLQAPLPYGSGFDWFGVRVSGDPVRLSKAMQRAAQQVVQVIDALSQQSANRGKPAVTGFSQGGMLSYTLAVLHPDKIGFAAPVSGWLPPQLWPKTKGSGALAPIVGFHGEADRGVPFEQCRLAVEHLLGLGYPVTFHAYPGLGHSMSRALIVDWDAALASALGR